MQANTHPYRSVLYMPGSNARALEKARSLHADALILDLEDAVSPDEKPAARALVAGAVAAGGFGLRKLIVRINGLETPWGADDLVAAVAMKPDAILIPKVSTPEDLLEVEGRCISLKIVDKTKLWAMMETPLGMLNAARIAFSSPLLEGMVMGTNDLVKDLGAAHTADRQPVMTGLGLCLLAARAKGLVCVDGVYNAFRDADGLRAACVQGRDLGFDGKTLIHPAQLEVANDVFAPGEADLEIARRQVAAFEDATRRGEGVAVVDGRIVENLHVEIAQRTLAKAVAIARMSAE